MALRHRIDDTTQEYYCNGWYDDGTYYRDSSLVLPIIFKLRSVGLFVERLGTRLVTLQ